MASRGRPSKFTQALADRICERLATGETLRAVCRDADMPSHVTVLTWAKKEPFSDQYAKARETGYAMLFDQMLEIADTPQQGVTVTEKATGTETKTGDMIEHRRLRVDTRKWMLAKALPKIYGDRLAHTDADGGSVAGAIVAALEAARARVKNARG